jgi:hypothetical protein
MQSVMVHNEATCLNCGYSETMGGCSCKSKSNSPAVERESPIAINERNWADFYSSGGSPTLNGIFDRDNPTHDGERIVHNASRHVRGNGHGGHAGAPEGALGIPVWVW